MTGPATEVDEAGPGAWGEPNPAEELLAGDVDEQPVERVDPQYPTLDAWVEQWLAQKMRRRLVGGVHWCPSWWAHPEAVSRLWSLWAAWELAQTEQGAALSVWWLNHLDLHWAVLTSSYGPFAACDKDSHQDPAPPLPCEPLPTTQESQP